MQRAADCGSCNVDAVVAAFAANADVFSFALPPMSSEQRKLMKQVVEKYPGMTCESFGFGADRQLHLFKAVSAEVSKRSVEVTCREASPDASTAASSTANASPAPSIGSPTSASRLPLGLPPPPGLEIRNTFIHFERSPIDPRTIQSMPGSIFKQCLEAEFAACAADALLPSLSQSSQSHDADAIGASDTTLSIGAEVIIDGLVKLPAFNGILGTVQEYDPASMRYTVLFRQPAAGCHKTAKVRAENLWCIDPALLQTHSLYAPSSLTSSGRATTVDKRQPLSLTQLL